MKDILRIVLRLSILFLIAPLIYFGMGWHELGDATTVYGEKGKEKQYAPNRIKPRSFYHAETVRGKAAIAQLGENHCIMATEKDTDLPQLVAASDYAGNVIVVAGKQAQLYIFRKKKKQYQLAEVLWDSKQDRVPKSLAISENGRYAAMMVESSDIPADISSHMARHHPDWRLQVQVFWDLDKGEKIQDGLGGGSQRLGRYHSGMDFVAVGDTLFMPREGGAVLNADFSWKKDFSDIYVGNPRSDFYSNKKEGHWLQAAYAPLLRQILILRYPSSRIDGNSEEEQKLYLVYDESREKWWKWWSNRIDLQRIPAAFSAYDKKPDKYPENRRMFPALEIAPDGKFFAIWRRTGILEAYGLPEGDLISKTTKPAGMALLDSSHMIIRDGRVYVTNGHILSTPESLNRYWSWKPGDAEGLRTHSLSCATHTRLLASGHMLTVGCQNSTPKLGLVTLADNSTAQTFSLPLKMP
ncbi:MAG: hypothetical protein LBF93_13020 [Zoogloeaceae bacterium]|jgi:hypothetical protein|nr:hypothetical protein [Zoogloeaceae bacterium]